MLKIITAATALTVLVACDSEGIDRVTDDTPAASNNSPSIVINDGQSTSETDENTNIDADTSSGTGTGTDPNAGTDDNGTTDADNGASSENDGNAGTVETDVEGSSSNADNGSSNADNDQTTNLDGGSSTSDGGQTVDTGSNTTDPDQTTNLDGGSSTSDGGQTVENDTDGQLLDDDANGSTTEDDNSTATPDDVNTDAGSFSSGVDGDAIRVSSLSSDTTANICTTRENPDDYSDTRVGDFILHNNAWRTFRAAPGYDWNQCITTNTNGELAGWRYDWGPGITGINGNPSASGDFYVRSYPELIYGTKDEFRTSASPSVTGLPVRVGDMPDFRIDYSYDGPQYGESRVVNASNNSRFPNGTTISGERNVAIESFFYDPDASGQCSTSIVSRNGGSNHKYEVMVWLDAGAERLPAGPDNFVADLNIRGDAYKVYTKSSDSRYIAFVAQNPQTTGTIYWNDFIDWARQNGSSVMQQFGALADADEFQDHWCMANIIVGTEIFWGAGRFDLYDWTITQSN